MPDRTNYTYIEPTDPEAEKACRLTRETVAFRAESPETFFASASEQQVLPNGYELRFADAPAAASRIDAFVADERECCPFFAFERWEEGGVHVLRILRLDEDAETREDLPPAVLEGARRFKTHSENARYECYRFSTEEYTSIRLETYAHMVNQIDSMLATTRETDA